MRFYKVFGRRFRAHPECADGFKTDRRYGLIYQAILVVDKTLREAQVWLTWEQWSIWMRGLGSKTLKARLAKDRRRRRAFVARIEREEVAMVVRGGGQAGQAGLAEIHEFVPDGVLHDILAMASRVEARRAFWQEHRRAGLERIRAQRAVRHGR